MNLRNKLSLETPKNNLGRILAKKNAGLNKNMESSIFQMSSDTRVNHNRSEIIETHNDDLFSIFNCPQEFYKCAKKFEETDIKQRLVFDPQKELYINNLKKNIQKFMLSDREVKENTFHLQDYLNSRKNQKHRSPVGSVPRERIENKVVHPDKKLLNSDQFVLFSEQKMTKREKLYLKQKINTGHNSNVFDNQNQHSNLSAKLAPNLNRGNLNTSSIHEFRQNQRSTSQVYSNQSRYNTLDPETPTKVAPNKLELPYLSRRSDRKRRNIPKSSAEKKLPKCFSVKSN